MKLQKKLLFSFVLIVLLSAILFSLLSYGSIDKNLLQYMGAVRENRLNQYEQLFRNYYLTRGSWDGVESLLQGMAAEGGRRWGRGIGMGRNGPPSFTSGTPEELLLLSPEGVVIADSTSSRIGEKISPDTYKGQIRPLYDEKGERIGFILLGLSPQSGYTRLENSFLKSVNEAVWISGGIALVIAILISLLISVGLTRPLKKLTQATQGFSKGDWSKRVKIKTNDEIGALALSFNRMADRLEQLEKVRKNLIADVAHELRTPLFILRGNLESMLMKGDPPNEERLALLHDETVRMAHMVNDLQNISLAEAGKLPLHKEEVNLISLVQKVVQIFSAQLEEKKISIHLDLGEELTSVSLDPNRIEQVLVNLIGNGIRYTPNDGVIEITGRREGERMIISVRDTGPGIAPDDLPYLFERFYRSDKGRSRTEGGTGLGLAIAKGYVEAHGGSIQAENHPEGGSIFTIRIPLESDNDL
ncbi:putative Sensor histidine kinase [[Clostridium] ultunense Esp]|nr:putative Sensor histidine kinase [[Clostridium] ultunense Esp]